MSKQTISLDELLGGGAAGESSPPDPPKPTPPPAQEDVVQELPQAKDIPTPLFEQEALDIATPTLTEEQLHTELTRRAGDEFLTTATVAMQAKMQLEAASIQRREDQHHLNRKPLNEYLSAEQVTRRRASVDKWAAANA